MGIYDGMNAAKTGSGRAYLVPGDYLLEIVEVGDKTAQDSFKGHATFWVEFVIISSTVAMRPSGTQASWAQAIKGKKDQREAAVSTIKQFLAAVLGNMTIFETPDPTTGKPPSAEAIAEAAASKAQPFKGRRLVCHCTNRKLKDGGDFTKHEFYPVK